MSIALVGTLATMVVLTTSLVYSGNNYFESDKAIAEARNIVKRTAKLEMLSQRKSLYDQYNTNSGGISAEYIKKQHELVSDIDLSAAEVNLIDRMGMAAEELVLNQNIEDPDCDDYANTGIVSKDECEVSKTNIRSYMDIEFNLDNENAKVIKSLNRFNASSDDDREIEIFTSTSTDAKINHTKADNKKIEMFEYYTDRVVASTNYYDGSDEIAEENVNEVMEVLLSMSKNMTPQRKDAMIDTFEKKLSKEDKQSDKVAKVKEKVNGSKKEDEDENNGSSNSGLNQ